MAADCKVARLQAALLQAKTGNYLTNIWPCFDDGGNLGGYKWVYKSVNGFMKSFGGVIRGLSRL